MNKIIAICIFLLYVKATSLFAQNFNGYVETENAVTRGDKIKVIKMSRKNNHVKVKYFTCKENGTLVGDRYREWAKNKKVITYTSGGYVNECSDPYRAHPVGVCFDNGNSVNERIKSDMDGLVIVYATGGVVASNLKEGNLSVTEAATNTSYSLDLRKPLDFIRFKRWAATEDATVFQTHLLYYKDMPAVGSNCSEAARERRLFAVCKDEDNVECYCLVNLAGNNTLYDATTKVTEYLKRSMDVKSIFYIINLETGCQDVFQAFDDNGKPIKADNFSGTTNISNASNLLVFYYE